MFILFKLDANNLKLSFCKLQDFYLNNIADFITNSSTGNTSLKKLKIHNEWVVGLNISKKFTSLVDLAI